MFFIYPSDNKRATFEFIIHLHKDESAVLCKLKDEFKIGNLRSDSNSVAWVIKSQEEVKLIIDIFSKNPLNTTKHLDFLIWSKAFNLYVSRGTRSVSPDLMASIIDLKDSMNRQRTDYEMPCDHKITITKHWLLGFVEGEGSFYVIRKGFILGFEISQAASGKSLFEEIKKFLHDLAPGFSNPSHNKLVFLNYLKPRKDGWQGMWAVKVVNLEFILKNLIPFLDGLTFYAKKQLDYQDWRAVALIKEKGLDLTEEGKTLITKILNQMNNNRLSTAKNKTTEDRKVLLAEIDALLNQPSIYELRDGRKFNLLDQSFVNRGGAGSGVAIIADDGTVVKELTSRSECARELGVTQSTISNRLKSKRQRPFMYKGQLCYLKAIN